MPVYNGESTIDNSIKSCINQSETNFELIIIDNGSIDDTKKRVQKYSDDKRIKYVYTEKKGRSRARNIGIKNSKGKYLLFLDSDDTINKELLTNGISFLDKNTSYFGYSVAVEYKFVENAKKSLYIPSTEKDMLYLNNQFPINSIMLRNNNIIYFHEDIEHNEDWLFFLENLLNKNIYVDINFVGANVWVHQNNTMKNLTVMICSKLYIRGKFRELFPNNFKIALDNLKLLFYVVFLFEEQDKYSPSKYFKKQYQLVRLFKRLPFINRYIYSKLSNKLKLNVYS